MVNRTWHSERQVRQMGSQQGYHAIYAQSKNIKEAEGKYLNKKKNHNPLPRFWTWNSVTWRESWALKKKYSAISHNIYGMVTFSVLSQEMYGPRGRSRDSKEWLDIETGPELTLLFGTQIVIMTHVRMLVEIYGDLCRSDSKWSHWVQRPTQWLFASPSIYNQNAHTW